MDYINAFWVGGLICALVQILLDRPKLMPGRIMVLLVCSGAVLGFLNIYQPFQEVAGAGASVPLLGFGNVLWNGVKEAVDKSGFLGIRADLPKFWIKFEQCIKFVHCSFFIRGKEKKNRIGYTMSQELWPPAPGRG